MKRDHTGLLRGCWSVALILAAIQTWLHRHSINTDGISYADVGRAFVVGDWGLAINGYWSPIYAWVLGATVEAVRPSVELELPTYHLVNLAIFVLALLSFQAFLSQLIEGRSQHRAARPEDVGTGISAPHLILLGYALFLYGTLDLISLEIVSPDLAVACIVFLSARQLLRISGQPRQWRAYLLLGAWLGVGYLIKTPVLPVSAAFLASCLLAGVPWREQLPRIAAALVVLAAIALPFTAALSLQKSRLTIGDSARLNYSWYINGFSRYHWQGEPAGYGTPRHTTRALHADPDVWEFGSPVVATYPTWADPSYWNDGLSPRLSVARQLRTVFENAREYYYIVHQRQTVVVLGFFLLLSGALAVTIVRPTRMLLVPSVAAALMFLVVHVEGRFVAGYIVVSWLGLYAGLRLPAGPADQRWTRIILAGVVVVLSLEVLAAVLTSTGDGPRHPAVARSVGAAGVPEGSRLAVLWPDGARSYAWARLGRHRIVAEAEIGGCRFWSLPQSEQKSVTDALISSPAQFAVAVDLDGCAPPAPWQTAADGRFAILNLGQLVVAP